MYDYTFSNNRPANKKNIAIIMVLCVAFGFLVITFLFMTRTEYDLRIPLGLCLIPACVAGLLLSGVMRKLTTIKSRFGSIILSVFFSWSVFTTATYSLNFFLSKHDTARVIETVVINKYSETRRRSTRSHQKKQYTAFVIVVKMPNDGTKKYDVSASEFHKYQVGDVVPLHIEQGFFGMPVMKDWILPLPAKTKKSRKK